MNRNIIGAALVWLCIGFNSASDVTEFLNTAMYLNAADARAAKIVQTTGAANSPLYEVFFPMRAATIPLPNNAVACAP